MPGILGEDNGKVNVHNRLYEQMIYNQNETGKNGDWETIEANGKTIAAAWI